jgi:transposase
MNLLYARCCGIDAHKTFVVACLSIWEEGGSRKEVRRFGTMSRDLIALREWLLAAKCTHVSLESTGVYWRTVYSHLYGYFELVVANAQHLKGVPGRKTDVLDAEWLADLLQHGLLRSSFVPSPDQQDLRDLTRTRISLVEERARLVNRIHKLLEEANVKLAAVLSDVMGVSGQAILHALAEGEEDGERLAGLAHRSVQHKHDLLVQALEGQVRPHLRFLLRELLCLIEALERSIAHVEQEIAHRLRPFDEQLSRLEAITGVSRRILEVLFAEVGWDMSRFPDAAHLASWAAMCPGQDESGGKRRSGHTRKGNRYVRAALVQAAHAASKTQTYLGEQYRRLAKRRGSKRAAIAVGHSILVIFYHMMKTEEEYHEKGVEFFQQTDKQRVQRHLVQRLERLGYQVTLHPLPAA